jgi:hypothetical protein
MPLLCIVRLQTTEPRIHLTDACHLTVSGESSDEVTSFNADRRTLKTHRFY